MRRNMDDDLREAERAARSGDTQAALRVYDMRRRRDGERDHQSKTTFLVDARGFGQIALTPLTERELRVEFGRDVRIGPSGGYQAKTDLPPYVVRGVPHRGDVRFIYYEGEGFVALGPKKDTGHSTYRDSTAWLYRTDQFHTEASKAARDKIVQVLTPIVNAWAASHRREMLDGEAAQVSNDVMSAAQDVDKARAALAEVEAKLADLVLRELAVEDAIRGL